MATTQLEKMRAFHEDIERFEKRIVELKMETPRTHKETITIEHKVNKYLDLIKDRSEKLQAMYEDKDGLRRDELVRMSGMGPEVYSVYFDILRESRNYYAKYPEIAIENPDDVTWNLVMNDDELTQFSGEESFGRFLDLHEHYVTFLNLKQNKGTQLDYTTYLRSFYKFDDKLDVKDRAYKSYLDGLLAYLISYFQRAQPLFDLNKVLKEADEEFIRRWEERAALAALNPGGGSSAEFKWSDQDAYERKVVEAELRRIQGSGAGSSSLDDIDGDVPPPFTSSLDDIDDAPPPSTSSASTSGSSSSSSTVTAMDVAENGNNKATDNGKEKSAADGKSRRSKGKSKSKSRSSRRSGGDKKPLEEPKLEGPVDLAKYASAKELESLGMNNLKKELQRYGLKCGGTLQERAARLFVVKDTPLPAIDPALLANGKKSNRRKGKRKPKKGTRSAELARTDDKFRREVAEEEYKIYKLANLLGEQIENTKLHIEKKQSRTPEEILAEAEEEEDSDVEAEDVEAVDDDEEDEIVIGKQNYPVGWDGKPIPYWLYKLHGLGIEYSCEICGNQSYHGRRAFERHFQEWRHAHGMRCLGIPNTRHFHDITKIQDAIELWQKLKEDTVVAEFRPDEEMEFEDAEGNVYAKKTYELLQKQGII